MDLTGIYFQGRNVLVSRDEDRDFSNSLFVTSSIIHLPYWLLKPLELLLLIGSLFFLCLWCFLNFFDRKINHLRMYMACRRGE